MEEAKRADELKRRAKKAALPLATYWKMRCETWDTGRKGKGVQEAMEAVRNMTNFEAEAPAVEKPFLTIAGPVGVGKTHLAMAIGWDWLEMGYYVVYRQAADLLDQLRSTYDVSPERHNSDWEYGQLMNLFKQCGLLIIDDLGAEKRTDWGDEKMEMIVDYRWINRRPLVVTTNALTEELSPRIADRLRDRDVGVVAAIEATSYRTHR